MLAILSDVTRKTALREEVPAGVAAEWRIGRCGMSSLDFFCCSGNSKFEQGTGEEGAQARHRAPHYFLISYRFHDSNEENMLRFGQLRPAGGQLGMGPHAWRPPATSDLLAPCALSTVNHATQPSDSIFSRNCLSRATFVCFCSCSFGEEAIYTVREQLQINKLRMFDKLKGKLEGKLEGLKQQHGMC